MLSGMVFLLFRGGRTQQKYNAHVLSPIFLNTLNTDARPQNCTTTNYALHFNMPQIGCTGTPKSPWEWDITIHGKITHQKTLRDARGTNKPTKTKSTYKQAKPTDREQMGSNPPTPLRRWWRCYRSYPVQYEQKRPGAVQGVHTHRTSYRCGWPKVWRFVRLQEQCSPTKVTIK